MLKRRTESLRLRILDVQDSVMATMGRSQASLGHDQRNGPAGGTSEEGRR
jgi:hypothetical protein